MKSRHLFAEELSHWAEYYANVTYLPQNQKLLFVIQQQLSSLYIYIREERITESALKPLSFLQICLGKKKKKNHFLIHMTDHTELHLCQPKADHVSVWGRSKSNKSLQTLLNLNLY